MTTIGAILQQQAQNRPEAPAIVDVGAGVTLTFAALELASRQAAALLLAAGLEPGDTVLLFQPMSAQLYVALMALFRLGMVAMFVDPSAGHRHVDQCCDRRPPRGLIASPKAHLLKLISPTLRQIPIQFSVSWPLPGARVFPPFPLAGDKPGVFSPLDEGCFPALNAQSPALLTFTSGSTGQPKAALRTHGFLMAQHRALARSLCLTPGAIDVTTLPIFVLANLASGVTSVIPDVDLRRPGAIRADRLRTVIEQYHPTSMAASPALLNRLVAEGDRPSQPLPSFHRLFGGGAPVFPQLLKQLQCLAPQAEVTAVYGSTEAEPIAHIAYAEMTSSDLLAMQQGKGLLVGSPVPEIRLRIVGDRWGQPLGSLTASEFETLCQPQGEIGEIVVSGEHVLPGYLDGHGDAETKFRVEGVPWHRTGDAGYLDEGDRLWLLGRCSARICDAYGVLYPFAVETAAQQVLGIRRTALVAHQGQRVLLVEWDGSPDDWNALKQTLAWAHIDVYRPCKIPLDKRHNAKVDYPALYRQLQKRFP